MYTSLQFNFVIASIDIKLLSPLHKHLLTLGLVVIDILQKSDGISILNLGINSTCKLVNFLETPLYHTFRHVQTWGNSLMKNYNKALIHYR